MEKEAPVAPPPYSGPAYPAIPPPDAVPSAPPGIPLPTTHVQQQLTVGGGGESGGGGGTTIVVQTGATPKPGRPYNCSRCGLGYVHHDYCTCCGVCWSILLFPFGLLCLCCCRDTWCTHCGRR